MGEWGFEYVTIHKFSVRLNHLDQENIGIFPYKNHWCTYDENDSLT